MGGPTTEKGPSCHHDDMRLGESMLELYPRAASCVLLHLHNTIPQERSSDQFFLLFFQGEGCIR